MMGVVGYVLPATRVDGFFLAFKSSSMMGWGNDNGKSIRSTTNTTVALLDWAKVSRCFGTGAGGEGKRVEGSTELLARGDA